ncbi:hypothetical protein HDU96_000955 [Phlyctochytrium bullatum]|nr:hypothetical protein HDU96_000955 [Phlyctochytrium bullatum]
MSLSFASLTTDSGSCFGPVEHLFPVTPSPTQPAQFVQRTLLVSGAKVHLFKLDPISVDMPLDTMRLDPRTSCVRIASGGIFTLTTTTTVIATRSISMGGTSITWVLRAPNEEEAEAWSVIINRAIQSSNLQNQGTATGSMAPAGPSALLGGYPASAPVAIQPAAAAISTVSTTSSVVSGPSSTTIDATAGPASTAPGSSNRKSLLPDPRWDSTMGYRTAAAPAPPPYQLQDNLLPDSVPSMAAIIAEKGDVKRAVVDLNSFPQPYQPQPQDTSSSQFSHQLVAQDTVHSHTTISSNDSGESSTTHSTSRDPPMPNRYTPSHAGSRISTTLPERAPFPSHRGSMSSTTHTEGSLFPSSMFHATEESQHYHAATPPVPASHTQHPGPVHHVVGSYQQNGIQPYPPNQPLLPHPPAQIQSVTAQVQSMSINPYAIPTPAPTSPSPAAQQPVFQQAVPQQLPPQPLQPQEPTYHHQPAPHPPRPNSAAGTHPENPARGLGRNTRSMFNLRGLFQSGTGSGTSDAPSRRSNRWSLASTRGGGETSNSSGDLPDTGYASRASSSASMRSSNSSQTEATTAPSSQVVILAQVPRPGSAAGPAPLPTMASTSSGVRSANKKPSKVFMVRGGVPSTDAKLVTITLPQNPMVAEAMQPEAHRIIVDEDGRPIQTNIQPKSDVESIMIAQQRAGMVAETSPGSGSTLTAPTSGGRWKFGSGGGADGASSVVSSGSGEKKAPNPNKVYMVRGGGGKR